eukprot:CAMPEP_0119518994 /NCGR_PEP_ID=MMETSP1344-20130328/35446_1 /TAXON_ID=236787 /ORGANISM="Florenciella parvula, Strain CCMP2471" /LENGTH=40 /DNA_ID= /DNA_START= /DNA_END= /DNA_ORIENTATION=
MAAPGGTRSRVGFLAAAHSSRACAKVQARAVSIATSAHAG